MNINKKLIIVFLTISITPMVMASYLFFRIQKENTTIEIARHLKSVASVQKSRIRSIVGQNKERLRLVASRTQLRLSLDQYNQKSAESSRGKINRIIDDALNSVSDFQKISVCSLQGEIIASTNRAEIGSNISGNYIFKSGKNGANVTHFSKSRERDLIVYLTSPLMLNDRILGVLLIESSTANFLETLSNYSGLGETGESLLGYQNESGDFVLLMPTRFRPDAALKMTISGKNETDPFIQSMGVNNPAFYHGVDYRNRKVIAVVNHLPEYDWILEVKIDEDEAMESLAQLRETFVLILSVSLLFIVGCSILLSNNLVKPVKRLTDIAKRISDGELDIRANDKRKDEIGSLGRAFNTMTVKLLGARKDLQDTIQQLEAEIEDHKRTQEELEEYQSHLEDLVNRRTFKLEEEIAHREQVEKKIHSNLKEKETLLQEIHHRVKNNMNVIYALLGLHGYSTENEEVREALKESQGRIYAMSVVHEILYQSENLAEIDLQLYLEKLTGSLIQIYAGSKWNVDMKIDAGRIKLDIEKASPLGLTINELITNSLKYAFTDKERGRITVTARLQESQLEMIIEDNGIGIPEAYDWQNSNSLGLQLAKNLIVNQLEGSFEMKRENGTKVIIRIHLDH